jgi:hypothetical protein
MQRRAERKPNTRTARTRDGLHRVARAIALPVDALCSAAGGIPVPRL